MAYAQGLVDKVTAAGPDRVNAICLRWSDTGVAAASEAQVPNIPKTGTILRYTATLTGGSGATINPTIGRAPGYSASTQEQVMAAPGAAAFIDVTGPLYYNTATDLFVVANPDTGTDNAVSHQLLIVPGWEG